MQLVTGSWCQLVLVFNLEPNPESRRVPEPPAVETSWRCLRSVDWGKQHFPRVKALRKCLPSLVLTRNVSLRPDCDQVAGPAKINLRLFPVLGAFPVSPGARLHGRVPQTPTQTYGQGQRQQCRCGVIRFSYSSLVPAAITHPLSRMQMYNHRSPC